MATQLLFYESVVPVSVERHRGLCVKGGKSYDFARNVNSVPLTAAEFAPASAEYPIVFVGDATQVMPAVILGATSDTNSFVSDDGSWGGTYIPGFVRRYPFVFAEGNDGAQLYLHIDESFEGCNYDGIGERLFDEAGEQTAYLQSVLEFLKSYQARFNRTRRYCERLVEHGLLRQMHAQFQQPTGGAQTLTGFYTIDRDRLKALDGDTLSEMARTDELECSYLHLASLNHFQSVARRNSANAEADAPAGAEDPAEPTDA